MISLIAIIVGVIFLVGVILDLKTKKVPSVLFTSLIFVVLFIAGISRGIELGYLNILFGLISGVFGYMLWELYFIGGLADIKALIIIGLLCSSLASLMIMIFLVVTLGTLYQAGFKYYRYVKNGRRKGNLWKEMFLSENEEPFLLFLFIVYIVLVYIGGII